MSTAFSKVISQAKGVEYCHEPFTATYYFGPERRCRRYGDVPDALEHSSAAVNDRLLHAQLDGGSVFVKDLAFQAVAYAEEKLLSSACHAVIFRHPGYVHRSLVKLKPDYTEEEFGFIALLEMVSRLEALGKEYLVVDGQRFREAPRDVASRYCDYAGLSYSDSMLHWRDGQIRPWAEDEVSSQAPWHRTLETSHGVLSPPAECGIPEVPNTALHRRATEAYHELKARAD